MMTLDEIKAVLCRGEHSSLTIGWNETNARYYSTVSEWLNDDAMRRESERYYVDGDFVGPDERQICIDTNSVWTAHWYPDSPVGCSLLHAATFEMLMVGLARIASISALK